VNTWVPSFCPASPVTLSIAPAKLVVAT